MWRGGGAVIKKVVLKAAGLNPEFSTDNVKHLIYGLNK